MKPTIGRIVHYVSRGSLDGKYPPQHVPMIVVLPFDGSVIDGWAMNPSGTRYEQDVPFDPDDKEPGTWHWPEREDFENVVTHGGAQNFPRFPDDKD